MHNPNFFRSGDSNNDEDRILNDGIVSIVGDDYLLSFLNDSESVQKPARPLQPSHMPYPYFNEAQMSFHNFQEQQRQPETFQSIYGKMNIQEPWMLQGYNEQNKMQFNNPNAFNLRYENMEDIDTDTKLKRVKTTKDTGFSVRKPPEVPSRTKNINKNTYVHKINHLIHESENESSSPISNDIAEAPTRPATRKNTLINKGIGSLSSVDSKAKGMKKVRSYDVLKPDEFNRLNVKLARNRESARKSRKRKKVYIELLEKKVDQLQQELNATVKQLEQNTTSLSQVTVQNKIMSSLYSGKQQLYEKLEKMLNSNTDETEISFLIDSLRLRLGANGKERVNAINYFFKQIIDFVVPVHMKYLLSVATQNKDIFSTKDTTLLNGLPPGVIGKDTYQNETTEYWQEIVSQLSLTEPQKKSIQKYKKKFAAEKQKFETLISNLNQIRKSLLKEGSCIQDLVDEFSTLFSPSQLGKILLVLDKERNRKEFSIEKLWAKPNLKKESGVSVSDDSDDGFLETGDTTQHDEIEQEDEEEHETMRTWKPAYPTDHSGISQR